MRFARVLLVGGLMIAPSLASAQEKNNFTDSWFWGAKGGVTWLHTSIARTTAPMFGAEWLITRTKFGLHVALDQAYFDAVSTVTNTGATPGPIGGGVGATSNQLAAQTGPIGVASGVPRRVNIRDMRRVSAAIDVFPWKWGPVRPYAGLGYSFNYVVRATSQGNDFASPEAKDSVLNRIENAKTRSSAFGLLGLQVGIARFAPFIQGTVMPTQGRANQFLINGYGFTYILEGGLRYNFGSSIDKLR